MSGQAASPVELSVVIPSWNTRELLGRCLSALEAARKPATEVLVVENGSEDGSAQLVRERFPGVILIENERNEGFARACNQGLVRARGRTLLLLNSDTEVPADGLERMLDFLRAHPDYGAVAPRLVGTDGSTQRTLRAFPGLWTPLFFGTPLGRWFPRSRELRRYLQTDWPQEEERDIDQPPAACLMLRPQALEDVGYFDEDLWLFFNDVDLALRMKRAGWKTRYLSGVAVLHHVGASTSRFADFLGEWQRNRLFYYRKHFGRLAGVYVKACVGMTFVDFALRQLGARVRGGDAELVRPMAWKLLRFLRQ